MDHAGLDGVTSAVQEIHTELRNISHFFKISLGNNTGLIRDRNVALGETPSTVTMGFEGEMKQRGILWIKLYTVNAGGGSGYYSIILAFPGFVNQVCLK